MKKYIYLLLCCFLSTGAFAQTSGIFFDGDDDAIVLCDSDDFNIGDAFTLEAWIFADTWKAESWQGSIINKDQQGPNSGFAFRAGKNGELSFAMAVNGQWPEVKSDQIMKEKQWYHVAVTIDGSAMTLYINGSIANSVTYSGSPTNNNQSVNIGGSPGFTGRYWNGGIDEVRIWKSVRTALQIKDNQTAELTGNEDNLVAYLPMEEGSGGTTENKVGGSCDGELDGPVWGEGWSVPAIDVGITKILSPDIVSLYERAVKVRVIVENFGSEAVSDIPLQMDINGIPEIEETYEGTLQPGEKDEFTFNVPIDVRDNNTNLLTLKTKHNEDSNDLNNASSYRFRKPSSGNTFVVLNEEQHNFGSAGQTKFTQVNMPESMEDYESILMHIWVECPSTGCDPWDQPAKISIINGDSEEFEVARFITPYGKGCGPWTVDVTDFKTKMSGPISVKSYVQVWGPSGWLVNTELEFIKSDTPNYQKVNTLWKEDYWTYGEPTVDDNLPAVTVDIHPQTESSHIRMTISGHGQGNTDNAAEFSQKTHEFLVDNTAVNSHFLWKSDCGQNICSNQAGTWTLSRAGWCPGQEVAPYIVNTTDVAAPGTAVEVDYALEDYTNLLNTGYNDGSHTEPHYRIHAFHVEQSNSPLSDFNNLRATDVTVTTNNDPNNPIYQSVQLRIMNTGTETITGAKVSYFVNGEEQIIDDLVSIEPGVAITHEFSAVSGFSAGEDHTVFGVVRSDADENINDDVAVNFINSALVNNEDILLEQVQLFPNPTTGKFTITVDNSLMNAEISIHASNGQVVSRQRIMNENTSLEINQAGIYMVRIEGESTSKNYRIVVIE